MTAYFERNIFDVFPRVGIILFLIYRIYLGTSVEQNIEQNLRYNNFNLHL